MMDTLRIEFPFDKQEFIETQKIKSNFLLKNMTLIIRIMFTLAVILMTTGWIINNDEKPINVFLFVGGLFLLYAILLLQSKWFSQRRHTRHARLLAERYENIGMDCIYEFTDASLRYWDAEKHFDLKWSVFKNYMFYKGYLVVLVGESLVDILMFRIVETGEGEEDYHKIVEYVKTKLEYKIA